MDYRIDEKRKQGLLAEQKHTTRMIPKRKDELLDGGSLYWVIKGNIQVRQVLTDIRPFTDPEGVERCDLVVEPRLILTEWNPRRAFQGWRYLKSEETPRDLGDSNGKAQHIPLHLRVELSNLGLL